MQYIVIGRDGRNYNSSIEIFDAFTRSEIIRRFGLEYEFLFEIVVAQYFSEISIERGYFIALERNEHQNVLTI